MLHGNVLTNYYYTNYRIWKRNVRYLAYPLSQCGGKFMFFNGTPNFKMSTKNI